MNPGDLNKRITFNNKQQVSDGAGGYEDGLSVVGTVWGNISPVSGREFFQAAQLNVELTHKITVRYNSKFNRTQVITHDGRTYDIQFAMEIGNKQFMEFKCVERL